MNTINDVKRKEDIKTILDPEGDAFQRLMRIVDIDGDKVSHGFKTIGEKWKSLVVDYGQKDDFGMNIFDHNSFALRFTVALAALHTNKIFPTLLTPYIISIALIAVKSLSARRALKRFAQLANPCAATLAEIGAAPLASTISAKGTSRFVFLPPWLA